VVAPHVRRDVDVEDVAVDQFARVRDAVADYLCVCVCVCVRACVCVCIGDAVADDLRDTSVCVCVCVRACVCVCVWDAVADDLRDTSA
jgi:hypothetical protein